MIKNSGVSVVIPTFNSSWCIKRCINSCLLQTILPLEIIIVDNGSKDNTIQIIKSYQKKNNIIKLLKYDDKIGSPLARNFGAKIASGTYLAFLDADDWWEKDKLEKQLTVLNSEKVIAVLTGVKIYNSSGFLLNKNYTDTKVNRSELRKKIFLRDIHPITSTMVIKKKFFNKVSGFDKNFKRLHDYQLLGKLSDLGEIINIHAYLTNIENSSLSTTSNQSPYDIIKSYKLYYDYFIKIWDEVHVYKKEFWMRTYYIVGSYMHRKGLTKLAKEYYIKSLRNGFNFKTSFFLLICYLPKYMQDYFSKRKWRF